MFIRAIIVKILTLLGEVSSSELLLLNLESIDEERLGEFTSNGGVHGDFLVSFDGKMIRGFVVWFVNLPSASRFARTVPISDLFAM